jgi:hypothetical protein
MDLGEKPPKNIKAAENEGFTSFRSQEEKPTIPNGDLRQARSLRREDSQGSGGFPWKTSSGAL